MLNVSQLPLPETKTGGGGNTYSPGKLSPVPHVVMDITYTKANVVHSRNRVV